MDWWLVAIILMISVPIGLFGAWMYRNSLGSGGFPSRTIIIPVFAISSVMAVTNGIRALLGNVPPMGFASAAAAAAFVLKLTWRKKDTPDGQGPNE